MVEGSQQQPWYRAEEIASTHDLIALFIYLIDARRFDEIETLVTPDITYENSGGVIAGWPAIRQGMDALTCFSATQHLIGNHLGWWNGDDFHGKTYCIASHLYESEGQEFRYEMGIRYDEHIVRVNDTLKLKRRKLNLLWQQDLPTTQRPPDTFLAAMARLMPDDKRV